MKLGSIHINRPSTKQVTVAYCQKYHAGSTENAENVIDACGDTKTYLRCVDYSDKGSAMKSKNLTPSAKNTRTRQDFHKQAVGAMSESFIKLFSDADRFSNGIGPILLSPGMVSNLDGLQQYREDVLSSVAKAIPEKQFYLGETFSVINGDFFDAITIRWVK